jgi:anthranilate synthase component II
MLNVNNDRSGGSPTGSKEAVRVLVLDNYDSFTYNLVHILRELNVVYEVHRNDKIALADVERFDKIMLSPGPGIPDEAGIMKPLIKEFGSKKSILGVCLGHQGIAEVYDAELYNIKDVLHGVTSQIEIRKTGKLFQGLPLNFRITHYHSWAVKPDSINEQLEVTAVSGDGLIMALSHKTFDVHGVQFHPESIMTEHGKAIIQNWLK